MAIKQVRVCDVFGTNTDDIQAYVVQVFPLDAAGKPLLPVFEQKKDFSARALRRAIHFAERACKKPDGAPRKRKDNKDAKNKEAAG